MYLWFIYVQKYEGEGRGLQRELLNGAEKEMNLILELKLLKM